jgi:hypothetical protein
MRVKNILVQFGLIVPIAVVMLAAGRASGDPYANFAQDGTVYYSPNHDSKAILQGTKYSVYLKENLSYTIDNDRLPLRNGRAFVTDDGFTIAWLLMPNGFYGSLTSTSKLLDLPALAVFKKGNLSKTYSLRELLVRPMLVKESASHTHWLREGKFDAAALTPDGNELSFKTTSFRNYLLDLRTGDLLQANYDQLWKNAPIIIWGHFYPDTSDEKLFSVESIESLKGRISGHKIRVLDETATYPRFMNWKNRDYWAGAFLTQRGENYAITVPFTNNFSVRTSNEPWTESSK